MTTIELIERIRKRGGQLRVVGARLQYRPAGILDATELDWLARHRDDVVRALHPRDCETRASYLGSLPDGTALGEAGPGVPAWHTQVAGRVPPELAHLFRGRPQ